MSNALIIGCTSRIARSLAQKLAEKGYKLYLLARNQEELMRVANDISVRFQTDVITDVFDAVNYDSHIEIANKAFQKLGSIDLAVVSLGELGEQEKAQNDFNHSRGIIESNYTGVASILTPIANFMEKQKSGVIVGISSVAGDRGRQSNYVYGSAKAALSTFLQGLRSRMAKCGVHVMTVKPGFVDTKMTYGKPGLFLVAQPEYVASEIIKAIDKRKNIIYVPWFWFFIMLIIRSIPEPIFKKLKL